MWGYSYGYAGAFSPLDAPGSSPSCNSLVLQFLFQLTFSLLQTRERQACDGRDIVQSHIVLFKHLLVFCSGVKVNTWMSKVALKMTYQNPNFCVEFIAWAKGISL